MNARHNDSVLWAMIGLGIVIGLAMFGAVSLVYWATRLAGLE